MQTLPEWITEVLVCPRDRKPLGRQGETFVCADSHHYPITQGVPIMLVDEAIPTHPYCEATLAAVEGGRVTDTEALGASTGPLIDQFVQEEIVKTNGYLYRDLKGRLSRYPIPEMRLPQSTGKTLLDVGSNWGRWTISAARKGYRAVGLDPSLDAILAAQRVARSVGVQTWYVVGDARVLPFVDGAFDIGYSYGVFQHFSRDHAREAVAELARITKPGGTVLLQMANRFGLRQVYNATKARLRSYDEPFRIRYWKPRELVDMFESLVGPCQLSVDGFFALNAQAADIDMLSPPHAAIVRASEMLRKLSDRRGFDFLTQVADSVYLCCSGKDSGRL